MRISLYVKFILAYITFGIAGFIAIATLSSTLTYDYLIGSRSSILYDEANLIASTYSTVYDGQDMELSEAYPQLRAIATFLHAEIWIMNREGTIITDSTDGKTGEIIENFDPTATGNKSYMTGNYFDSFPYDVMSVSAPIVGNYTTYGYVVIHLPMTDVIASQNQILNIVYITSMIIFSLSLIILIVFQVLVYNPLKQITEGAKQYADRNLTYQINISSHDEMGYLANTLNFMSRELNESENYQKKFITNISHDFRSPLTSIKGFLEAILDGTIPTDMQETYMMRVIEETKRLTKLTESILALKSLDMKGHLSRSDFDINKVIKDTAASFEVQCMNRGILLDLTFCDEETLVFADHDKIQQVLYNLIDNAIKFSNPSSTIFISTTTKREKIFISVKDTGIGIIKNDQKKIFDRFYKSDNSRGKDKKGSGLGLSIVKDIIQAHGENIDVISTIGTGTTFIFSLPSSTNA